MNLPREANATATQAGGLRISAVSKSYGAVEVLHDVSLDVRPGSFVTLLGPSGSGKSTLLMCIAGFEAVGRGDITLDGASILELPPERRDFGMVFQGYALFPHLSVAENVAFPLSIRGMGRAERERRVADALAMVRLEGLSSRLPRQLSGGQQQRVALARAIVFSPRLLLLDEPLSALDRGLRAEMQEELKRLHGELGLSFIYVTHDQEEALFLSDQVAILNHGRIQQIGPPEALYARPVNQFVAGFLGRSNLLRLHGEVRAGMFHTGGPVLAGTEIATPALPDGAHSFTFCHRPERATLAAPGGGPGLEGVVTDVAYHGTTLDVTVRLPDGALFQVALLNRGARPVQGDAVRVVPDPDSLTPLADGE
ncbi:ABC transporter ATP-binding protein [Roseococcus suduntuyensis]|nr:ABC transporter ATP-binding protein [Roseococcus suduntuyensis]